MSISGKSPRFPARIRKSGICGRGAAAVSTVPHKTSKPGHCANPLTHCHATQTGQNGAYMPPGPAYRRNKRLHRLHLQFSPLCIMDLSGGVLPFRNASVAIRNASIASKTPPCPAASQPSRNASIRPQNASLRWGERLHFAPKRLPYYGNTKKYARHLNDLSSKGGIGGVLFLKRAPKGIPFVVVWRARKNEAARR